MEGRTRVCLSYQLLFAIFCGFMIFGSILPEIVEKYIQNGVMFYGCHLKPIKVVSFTSFFVFDGIGEGGWVLKRIAPTFRRYFEVYSDLLYPKFFIGGDGKYVKFKI